MHALHMHYVVAFSALTLFGWVAGRASGL